eukprot:scaffold20461_cov117-Cylindrotheca_fusiformis.AAC.5
MASPQTRHMWLNSRTSLSINENTTTPSALNESLLRRRPFERFSFRPSRVHMNLDKEYTIVASAHFGRWTVTSVPVVESAYNQRTTVAS